MTIPILPSFSIETDLIHLRLEATQGAPQVRIKDKDVTVFYPSTLDFKTARGQQSALFFVTESLRRYAKRTLVPLLRQLAIDKGVPVQRITIKDIKTRWGSCSSLGNINLSLWLLLFPSKYILYVMCHELAHFAEMNHSPAFWQRVDALLGQGQGMAKQLDKEMTQVHRQLVASWRTIYQTEGLPRI